MLKRTTTVSSAIYLIGQPLLLNAISVPAMAYIIRQLGPQPYGEWSVAVSLIATTTFLSNLGLRTLFVRYVAQHQDRAEEAMAEQLGLRFVLAVIGGLLALLLCLCMRYPPVVLECVGLAALGLVLSAIAMVGGDALQGFQCFKAYASASLISGLLLTAASVIAVWKHTGPVGLSIAYLVGPGTSLILLLSHVHRHLFPVRVRWSLTRYATLLHEVRAMGGHVFLATLQDQIEKLIVPKAAGLALAGYFSAGSMPANRLAVFPDGLATALFPAISRSASKDRQNVAPHVIQLLAISLAVCVPLAMLVMFLAMPISQILFRHNPLLCRTIINITIWSIPLQGIALPMIYSLQAVGSHASAARSSMGATLVGIALSCVLVIRFGVVGACWSSLGRWVLAILFLLPQFIRTFPSVLPSVPLGRIVLCTAAMGLPMWLSTVWLHSSLLGPVVGGLLAIGIYVATLVLLRVVKASELQEMLQNRSATP